MILYRVEVGAHNDAHGVYPLTVVVGSERRLREEELDVAVKAAVVGAIDTSKFTTPTEVTGVPTVATVIDRRHGATREYLFAHQR